MMSILQMSISAGFLVAAIVILRAVALNKLPKTMFLVLWGVALCRLLMPVSVPSRFSIYSILDEAVRRKGLNASIPATAGILSPAHDLAAGTTVRMAPAVQPAAQGQVFLSDPVTMVWLAGMLAVFFFFAVVYFKNYRELRFALPVGDNVFIEEWLAEYRLIRSIAVLQSDRITTPLAVGLANPRILLPKSMRMDDQQLMGYVLTHEYYHIKRFDLLWKFLLALVLCIHWFNPLVWVMFILVNRDLELTCDEMVVRRFGADTKTAYACSLIAMAEQRSKFSPLYTGFSKNAAEERITAIMKYKKPSAIAIVLAALLVIGTTTAFALSGMNANDKETSGAPSGLADTSAIIKLADLDTDLAQYQIASINHITSRPEFEFYITCKDIAKIELSSETEYLYIVDWTETQADPYSKDGATSITQGGRTIDKTAVLTFDEGFTDYDKIWCRWTGYNLYTWASEDDYSHFLGIGGVMENMTSPDGLPEEDKLKLAAGDDGLGTTGLGHIQLDGYPEELLKDRITVKLTDRQGNVATRYVDIKISNNELRQLVVTASLEN